MSRMKLIAFGVIGLVCCVIAIGLAFAAFTPVESVNAAGATQDAGPVTWQAWLTMVVTALGGAGFTTAAVREVLTSSLTSAVGIGRMKTIKWLIKTAKTPDAKAGFVAAARSECDFVRDTEFKGDPS